MLVFRLLRALGLRGGRLRSWLNFYFCSLLLIIVGNRGNFDGIIRLFFVFFVLLFVHVLPVTWVELFLFFFGMLLSFSLGSCFLFSRGLSVVDLDFARDFMNFEELAWSCETQTCQQR